MNALFARAAEEAAAEADMRVVRLTVDLFRPVPLAPLDLTWRFVRKGGRLANVEASLTPPGENEPISRAIAVLLRETPGQAPSWEAPSAPPPPPDTLESATLMPKAARDVAPPGFHWSFDIRMTEDEHGPAAWITSPLDLCPGEPMTPIQRSAAVADLTFGLSGRILLDRHQVATNRPRIMMINTDTTLYWQRPPQGDWFAFRHAMLADEDGVGIAETVLYDRAGRLGRSLQALVGNEPRRSAKG